MKTEDELDAEVAKLFDVENAPDGKVKKRLISDEETVAQMEREEAARRMEEACGLFLTREREFQRIAQHPRVVTDPQMNALWWDRLEAVYVAEKAVQKLFTGPQPTMAENQLWVKFRKLLLEGSKLKANA
jgi:hypothetical protein